MHTSHTARPIYKSPLLFWAVVLAVLLYFLGAVSSVLLPFTLGLIVAYCFDPLADRLERARFSRTTATAIITVALFLFLSLTLIWLIPLLAKQLTGLFDLLPQALRSVQQFARVHLGEISQRFGMEVSQAATQANVQHSAIELSKNAIQQDGSLIKGIVDSGMALLNVMSLLFITPIVSFYALRDWDRMVEHVDALIPRKQLETVRLLARDIDKTLAGFLRGQLNVMLVLAIYYCVALTLVGVPFALVIGVLTALLIIVPYVGTIASMGTAVIAMAMETGIGTEVYIVLGIYLLGQVMEQNILTPKIVGDEVGLPPLWMLFAMLSGATLFGFVGMLIAVPVAAVLGVLVRFAVEQYRNSHYYDATIPH